MKKIIQLSFMYCVLFNTQIILTYQFDPESQEFQQHQTEQDTNIRYIQPHEIDPIKSPELTKFIQTHSLSQDTLQKANPHDIQEIQQFSTNLQQIIDDIEHGNSEYTPEAVMQIGFTLLAKTKEMSPSIDKGSDISRIVNSLRLKKIIEKHALNRLHATDKFLFQGPTHLTIMAQRGKFNRCKNFSLLETQQIAKLVEETGFLDWAGDTINNIAINENGKIEFFDTEDKSFGYPFDRMSKEYRDDASTIKPIEIESIPGGCKFKYITHLHRLYRYMKPEAQEWYLKRVHELNSPEGFAPAPRIYNNTQYDDPEIDLQKVKTEWRKLGKSYSDLQENS
ncbi:hypothetical protein KBC04_02500 [Candidatus Babeliales bacterium]|nr:hypothetical protein [Candidatus Babeliales bacterium]MBP9843720.1 hypothetical protein [Candidatus Babeliales bacterium]